jgi:hypothetical protein
MLISSEKYKKNEKKKKEKEKKVHEHSCSVMLLDKQTH